MTSEIYAAIRSGTVSLRVPRADLNEILCRKRTRKVILNGAYPTLGAGRHGRQTVLWSIQRF
ncbi:MAG: hypothetical protein VYA69_14370 [Gemmatimonadota bacterium]|nr:hypothetical protein [Gemmatimonadota bacterium]